MDAVKNMVEVSRLSKRFGDLQAVSDLSFRVKRGELFAFLGVNGAGKSTTISILCGQLKKDGGEVWINGKNLEEDDSPIRRETGVVFQNSRLDSALSARDNLVCRAGLYGITGEAFEKRLVELDRQLHLEELLNRPVGKLSGGQRRRVDLARALIHKPALLILDEPTTGLDPQTRRLLWEVIGELRQNEGLTVFLTTHYMEEAADADYVVILDAGKIAAEGTPLALKNQYTGDYVTLYGVTREQAESLGLKSQGLKSQGMQPQPYPVEALRDAYRICLPDTKTATELILENPALFADYEVVKGKMEDVFLAVTGKRVGEDEDKKGREKKR